MSPRQDPDVDAAATEATPPGELGTRARTIATVMWCSFLAASGATMISFALVDPAPIAALLPWAGPGASRTTLYSFGFLYFWAICAAAAALTAFMLTTPPAEPPAARHDIAGQRGGT